jgi:protein-tyrosine phosphatase
MSAVRAPGEPLGFDGMVNLREVAGLPTMDGRRLRRGVLYRGDTPQFLSARAAADLVSGLGIRTILDLRLPSEVRLEGRGPLADLPPRHVSLPFDVGARPGADSSVGLMSRRDPVVTTYLHYLAAGPASVVGVVAELARGELPALVHCTVGKDRTGVAVAVLLDALGVDRAAIADDYSANADGAFAAMERLRTMVTYGADVDRFPARAWLAEPASILRFLSIVDERHGGVAAFLARHGVGADVVARLRDRLLEPAAG